MSWRRGVKIQLVSVNLYARVVAYCFPALCTPIRNHLPPSCPFLGVDYESTRFLVSFTVTHTRINIYIYIYRYTHQSLLYKNGANMPCFRVCTTRPCDGRHLRARTLIIPIDAPSPIVPLPDRPGEYGSPAPLRPHTIME